METVVAGTVLEAIKNLLEGWPSGKASKAPGLQVRWGTFM
jgi:hypothetical protein